jgi:hypothetical protein
MRKLAHELCWCELLLYILLSTREFLYNPVTESMSHHPLSAIVSWQDPTRIYFWIHEPVSHQNEVMLHHAMTYARAHPMGTGSEDRSMYRRPSLLT